MRAAVLHEYGVPRAGEFAEPVACPEQAVVEVLAAGVNPVDAAISAGRFYGGRPSLPSVAGREGVATLDGERVYFDAPVAPFGSMAERALIDPRATYRIPDEVDDGLAVALGISGLAAGQEPSSEVSDRPSWSPPVKIAAKYLAPYLERRDRDSAPA